MTLSAIQLALRQAEKASCSSNLRQWSSALRLYANANDQSVVPSPTVLVDEDWQTPLNGNGTRLDGNPGPLVSPLFTGWTFYQETYSYREDSLTWVPVQLTQSVIPIGAILFIIAELLSLPAYWRQIADGISSEH